MIANVCLLFLILTFYIFIYNVAIFIFAKLYGVIVEEFRICYAPFFSLINTKIRGTQFILGWLPLGGSIKMTGMYIDEDKIPQPPDFACLSWTKQTIITYSGPFINLLVGLYCAHVYLGIDNFFELVFSCLVISFILFLYFQLVPKIIKNKNLVLNTGQKISFMIIALVLYLSFLYLMVDTVNSKIHFIEHIHSFLASDVKLKNMLPILSFHQKAILGAYLGIFMFIMNLLPIGGMNGYYILQAMYTTLSGSKISNEFTERYTVISMLILLIISISLYYKFFS